MLYNLTKVNVYLLFLIVLTPVLSNAFLITINIFLTLFLFIVKGVSKEILSYVASVFVFFIYLMFLFSIGFSQASYGTLINYLHFFLIPIYLTWYLANGNNLPIRYLAYILLFNLIYQVYGLINDPLLLYQMNFRDTSSSEYLNIGGTIYVFGTMIISLYLCFYTSLSRGIKF